MTNINKISYKRNGSDSKITIYKTEINTVTKKTNSTHRKNIFCKICGEIIGSAGLNHTCDIIHS